MVPPARNNSNNRENPPSPSSTVVIPPTNMALRSDYPSWLPRRPPPPAPASTVGTNTPMPAELGEFGEQVGTDFEQQYRDYLQYAAGAPSPGAEDADISNSTNGGNINADTTRASEDADVDYLRREAQAILESRGRPSTTSAEDSPGDAIPPAQLGGRKANSRSVRIVNLGQDAVVKGLGREGTDQTRVASDSGAAAAAVGQTHARAHSQSNWYSKNTQNESPRILNSVSATRRLTGWYSSFAYAPASGLRLEMLRSPSMWMKVYYRLWPILVFGHLPVQAFLDFNAVYMLLQVSRYPLPTASPNSGKNWALCAAGYIACWLISVLAIFVLYELVYSFARRWRVRRPLIFPLYLSSPGYNYACLTSFNLFCFFQHLRWTAFFPLEADVLARASTSTEGSALPPAHLSEKSEHTGNGNGNGNGITEEPREPPAAYHRPKHARGDSDSSIGSLDANEDDPALRSHQRSASYQLPPTRSQRGVLGDVQKSLRSKARRVQRKLKVVTWRDGLAETFNLYSQNLPNVLVLVPRAAMALGLVLAFSPALMPEGSIRASSTNAYNRDPAFFRKSDGLLTQYSLGVLYANIAWTAWRSLVLLCSWIGLWVLSGHGCAGICGPRDKLSRTFSLAADGPHDDYSDAGSVLPWEWRECTKARVKDAWEYCLVGMKLRWGLDEKRESHHPSVFPRDEKPKPVVERRAEVEEDDDGGLDDEGLKRVLAAVGFGGPTSPSKRPALRQDLFEAPSPTKQPSSSLPKDPNAPLLKLPYPFTKPGSGQVSSSDLVPFPVKPSPKHSSRNSRKSDSAKSKTSSKKTSSSSSGSGTSSGSGSGSDDEEEEDEEEEEESSSHEYSAESSTPSSSTHSRSGSGAGRASNSMSSLGHPIPSSMGINARAMMRSGGNGSGSRPNSRSSPNQPLAHVQRQAAFGAYNSSNNNSPVSGPGGVIGNTRFPFLSSPALPSTYNPHQRHRHPAGRQSGSSGHSRGLSQVSGMSGISGISGISMMSTGTGAMTEVPGAGMSEEGGDLSMSYSLPPVVGRDRNESEQSGSSSGSASRGSDGLPMPPRHPHLAQGRRKSRTSISTGSKHSSPAPEGSVAFPTGAAAGGKKTPPSRDEAELGMGVLAQENIMRGIRGRYSFNQGNRSRSARIGEEDGESLQLSLRDRQRTIQLDNDDSMYEEEEVQGEREDVVGLLGTGSGRPSPRASIIGSEGQRSRDSSVAGGRRPISLSLISGERSRNNSFTARQRRESVASAARERVSSFGVRMRERAQSLLQSVVGRDSSDLPTSYAHGDPSMSQLPSTPGHRRLASATTSDESAFPSEVARVTGSASATTPEIVRLASGAAVPASVASPVPRNVSGQSAASMETGESSGSGSGSSGRVPRTQQLIEEDAYASSSNSGSGSHSRSGSESINADRNYTFGRPVPFLPPRAEHVPLARDSDVEEETDEEVSRNLGRVPVPASSSDSSEDGHGRPIQHAQSDEDTSERYFSPPMSSRTRTSSATPSVLSSGGVTPVPGHHQPSFADQQALGTPFYTPLEESPRQAFLTPSDALSRRNTNRESVSMLSSAAPSFVTTPSFIDSSATSSSGATLRGSAGDSASPSGSPDEHPGGLAGLFMAARPRLTGGRRDSGMVERAGDGAGAGGHVGEGRIA
ncbi:hypothetical protein BKA70DRAFT_1373297 [Coprinopsis sp. MPI-PUGE-AT-0042]|nr:hypothetical protein BKA70DRAFT_1373297 [Coprinopsis sp. MPI-PUGE-AT-0042]